MQKTNQSVRSRIIQATHELLQETKDTDKISVRQIAERAKVGVGSVNYNFISKDALLCEVIAEDMSVMADEISKSTNEERSPGERLRKLVAGLYDLGAEHMSFVQFMIRQNLNNGDLNQALILIPLLKEIFGDDIDEMHLRILALQIILPIQLTSLAPDQFFLYSGIDIRDAQQRESFVNQLIDNLF